VASFKSGILEDVFDTYLSTRFELRKHMQRKRILTVAALALLMPLIFYVVPKVWDVAFFDTAASFANSNLGFVNLLIIISGAMFAGDVVSSEFENRTGLMLFPSPQKRTSIFVGKYVAALIATYLAVSIYYVVTALEIFQIYGTGSIPVDFTRSFLLALLYSTSAVSIMFFFSSVLKRAIISSFVGFFMLMMVMPIISAVLSMVGVDPWFLVTHSSGLITDVFGIVSEVGNDFGPRRFMVFTPELYTGIKVMAAYAVTFFLAGIAIANRRRME